MIRSLRALRDDLVVVLPPWVVARIVVVVALALSRFLFNEIGAGARPVQLGDGLLGWDADWNAHIAGGGYEAVGEGGLRFFPLVPLLARWLAVPFLGNTKLALLVLANVSAFAFMVLLRRLALRETGDARLAARTVWFSALWPAAFVLVMGYAEATFLVLAVGFFLAVRSRRWAWAIPLGLLAGLTRPFGALLVLPAVVEAWRWWRSSASRERVLQVAATIAAPVGSVLYLWWVQIAWGDFFLPFRLQSDPARQGSFRDPASSLVDAGRDLVSGDRFGSGLHLVWALLLIALLVVVAVRLQIGRASCRERV